jgi:hypothetical protein
MRKPNVYDIKRVQPEDSYYFERKTLKAFGQTMASFTIRWDKVHQAWATYAPIFDREGQRVGESVAYWHAQTLQRVYPAAAAPASDRVPARQEIVRANGWR